MKTVDRGAAFLDEHVPGWEEKIDLDRLDLASNCYCVLGQLYLNEHPRVRHRSMAFTRKARELFGSEWSRDLQRLGFVAYGNARYVNVTEAWRRLIRRRQRTA